MAKNLELAASIESGSSFQNSVEAFALCDHQDENLTSLPH